VIHFAVGLELKSLDSLWQTEQQQIQHLEDSRCVGRVSYGNHFVAGQTRDPFIGTVTTQLS
jgi:hypothetical protein